MIHIWSGTKYEGIRSHHTTQNDAKLKTSGLFISGFFYLSFLDLGWLWLTETVDGGGVGDYYTNV